MPWRAHGLDEAGAARMDETSPAREPIARVRIRGGRIICTACGRSGAEVVVFEPDRPICADCVLDRLTTPERLMIG